MLEIPRESTEDTSFSKKVRLLHVKSFANYLTLFVSKY
jgi:hypothetical protein